MALKVARFINLFLIIVALGALLAHFYEMPAKLALSGPDWLATQLALYRGWGPFLGPFEVGGVISTWTILVFVRKRQPAFALTLIAALCLSAGLALFFILVNPVNHAFATWTPATIPSDWTDYRARWEYGHAVRAMLAFVAFLLLIGAVIAETPVRAQEPLR